MAGRRYVRDNRGRFATVGATARGGRLRTAAGNKRETVKGKIDGAVPAGTIRPGRRSAKPKVAAPAPSAARQRVRGNFRPRNTMAKPGLQENPFGNKDQSRARNVEIAQNWLRAKGVENVGTYSQGRRKTGAQSYARTTQSTPLQDRNGNISFNEKPVTTVEINRANTAWKNPAAVQRERRASGWISSSSPVHTLNHEIGHTKDPLMNKRPGGLNPWDIRNPDGSGRRRQAIARRVSGYAAKDPDEFVAETYAGRRAGRRYDHQVMRQYYAERRMKPRSVRSQLKK